MAATNLAVSLLFGVVGLSEGSFLGWDFFDSTIIPFKIKLNKNLPLNAKNKHPKVL